MKLKSNMAVRHTISGDCSSAHFHKIIIQPTDGQYDLFLKKVPHIYQMKTVHILHIYFDGLALGCQDFRLLQLKKGIATSSSHIPNLNFIIRSPLHIVLVFFSKNHCFVLCINYKIILFLIEISLHIIREGK